MLPWELQWPFTAIVIWQRQRRCGLQGLLIYTHIHTHTQSLNQTHAPACTHTHIQVVIFPLIYQIHKLCEWNHQLHWQTGCGGKKKRCDDSFIVICIVFSQLWCHSSFYAIKYTILNMHIIWLQKTWEVD